MFKQSYFEIETCYHTLINSTWFCTFVRHDDETVTILQYERDHMRMDGDMRYGKPIEEKGTRIVTHLDVDGSCFIVRNSQHVFNYK
jgi:hypothetical protein